jgi:D-alanine--(R)-lactate ligase
MHRLRVGIIFGGCSEEHPISVKSAQEVARHLDIAKYEPFYVGITTSGAWKLCDGPDADWENGSCRPAALSPDRSVHGLLVLDQGRYETISLDLVLPVLHGKLGEDGALQGLLELCGIPYAGCDVQSSALCMDKSLTYIVARAAGIATPKFWTVTASENIDPDQLTYPVFVKPARSGSSFGVSKTSRKDELPSAVEAARQYDSKVLIEEAVVGSEVGCAILGNDLDLLAMDRTDEMPTGDRDQRRHAGRGRCPAGTLDVVRVFGPALRSHECDQPVEVGLCERFNRHLGHAASAARLVVQSRHRSPASDVIAASGRRGS